MLLLIIFSFVAGVVTVLSPCILPVLPLILSSSVGKGEVSRSRPVGVVVGFVLSFTLFTLFLSTLVRFSGISADSLRFVSIAVIAFFGLSLLIPAFQAWMEGIFSRLTGFAPRAEGRRGFGGGLVIGFSLGLLWTPCVGPILASVISLALTGSVTLAAFFITFAYALGTAIPMLLIMRGGRELLMRVPWLLRNTGSIQKGFGVLMILVALAIYTNLDRTFQTYIIETFPRYGAGLTRLEDRASVREALENLQTSGTSEASGDERKKPMSDSLSRGPLAPELIPGGTWINSEPLALERLRGKVVVIDFWTYSCINCQRTLPYLRQWHEKYADKGLVIIGVHAPEFEFEKSEKNLRKAVEDFGLGYPIMQDNDFATWRAYSNRYWPAKYFIDKDGHIRFTHFGEGAYDESEEVIQKLLEEAGAEDVSKTVENPTYENHARTPETYLGYERIGDFASLERIVPDQEKIYTLPSSLRKNAVAYGGMWRVAHEYASPGEGAVLELDFEAKEVFLVMRPKSEPGTIRVLVDGKVQYSGKDVEDGMVTVDTDTLYRLVDLPFPGRHTLRLEFLDENIEIYAFTFG